MADQAPPPTHAEPPVTGPLAPLSTEGFKPPARPAEPGPAPMLQWVRIADLVVDARYQRTVAGAGRGNVRRIAEGFRWSRFAPLVVAPVEGGRFAVIDGQHRATAAALLGIEQAPAQVVIADTAEQADAFRAINGQTTRVSPLQVHHAARAAGDPGALALQAVADAAGVVILRSPREAARIKAGETMAIGAIVTAIRAYGRDTTITALQCITETANNTPGALSASNIRALCAVLGANLAWREGGERLLAAFDEIDLLAEAEEARATRRPRLVAVWEVLADRLRERLAEQLDGRLPAQAAA